MAKHSKSIEHNVVVRPAPGYFFTAEDVTKIHALVSIHMAGKCGDVLSVSMPMIEHASLVGDHVPDFRVHLARDTDHGVQILCGAMMGLAQRGDDPSEPTQHTPWTKDKSAWSRAENPCRLCAAEEYHDGRR